MKDDRPIIIVKKKRAEHGHHGGSWKVAYADFVTAMMAFFLVMWILGLSQETRKSIAAYFNDPTGMMKSHAGGQSPMSMGRLQNDSRLSILPSLSALLKEVKEKENKKFQKAKETIEQMVKETPEFKPFSKSVDITITQEGLRIELLEGEEALFFQTGSATLKPKTVDLLRLIGRELSKLPNRVVFEGHTDARPYTGGYQGYSNFELSSDRANSARRAMMATVRPKQVTEVRGYADRHLRNSGDPFHFSNRRISILVGYTESVKQTPIQEIGPNVGIRLAKPQIKP